MIGYTTAITSALSAVLDQPGYVLFLRR